MDPSTTLSEAVSFIEDIRAYDSAVEQSILQAQHLADLLVKKTVALEALTGSVKLRRALLYLPLASHHAPTTDAVLEVWLKHFPGSNHSGTNNTKLGELMLQIFKTVNVDSLSDTQRYLSIFVRESLPAIAARRFLQKPVFWKLLLTREGFDGSRPLSLGMVFSRLTKFNRYLVLNPKLRLKESDASIWLDSDYAEREKILLEISSRFPSFLSDQLKNKFQYCYLDDIVPNVGGLSPSALRQRCAVKNMDSYQKQPPTVTGIDLTGSDGVLLGTVLQLDNVLSPSFVRRYLEAMDRSKYTQDGAFKKHDRGYRFASKGHESDGIHPCWIAFGSNAGTSVLLSQACNDAENSLLSVVNFIYFTYSEFVNKKFVGQAGATAKEKWGLPEEENGYYDSLMTMVSDPTQSNYGMHDDGKPGLCSTKIIIDEEEDTVPDKYSKFNLVVPTVAIQNQENKTVEVRFRDKRESTGKTFHCVGAVTCGVVTIHVQLIGVQHTCEHVVSVFWLPIWIFCTFYVANKCIFPPFFYPPSVRFLIIMAKLIKDSIPCLRAFQVIGRPMASPSTEMWYTVWLQSAWLRPLVTLFQCKRAA
jgi:hypothetical protein